MSTWLTIEKLKEQFAALNNWRDSFTEKQLWVIDHATLCVCHPSNESMMRTVLESTRSPFTKEIKLKISEFVAPNTVLFLDETKLSMLDEYWMSK